MPPASPASFTSSTALRICRHCLAEAQIGVALEDFPHHAGCPRLEDFGARVRGGLEQLADAMSPLFAKDDLSDPANDPHRNFLDCEEDERGEHGIRGPRKKLWPVGVHVYPNRRPASYRTSPHGDPLA